MKEENFDGLSGLAGIFIKYYTRGVEKYNAYIFPHLYIESLKNRCQPRQPVKRRPGNVTVSEPVPVREDTAM